MASAILQEGTTSNRYTILGRIAGGGMAEIFLARVANEAGIERHVVLKRVLASRLEDETFARMFLDEARLAAQLQHPNIAQLYDIGMLGGSYFFTMEFVHGEDVRTLMKKVVSMRRLLPIQHALYIASNALAALHHAHERLGKGGTSLNIVHRDVSPSNVMVGFEGAVKLLDFGVAKATMRSVETRAGTIKGKIEYLSPEQCHGVPIDRRSDLFSLGIVLHEMLAGRRLYRRESDFETMSAIVKDPVPPPSTLRPDLPASVDQIVLKALAKKPSDRYATAADMIDDIENVAAAEHISLSSNAMGRFMRELFGARREPWRELIHDDATREVTITTGSVDLIPDDGRALEEQLEHAPSLSIGESVATPVSENMAFAPPAVAAPMPMVVAAPMPTAVAAPMPTAVAAPMPMPEPVVPMSVAPPPIAVGSFAAPHVVRQPMPIREAGSAFVIVVTAAIAIGGVVVWKLSSSSKSSGSESASAHPSETRPTQTKPTETKPTETKPTQTKPSETKPTQTKPSETKPSQPTNAVANHPAPPRIEDLVAGQAWNDAVRACEQAKTWTASEHASCGVAACNAGKRSVALEHYKAASGTAQSTIARSCQDHGIALVAKPTHPRPQRPSEDPCEANPLACQK